MNRTLLNIIIDLIAAVLFLGMIATGYLLRFPLPPGSNKSLVLWGLGRHQWGDVHFWISLALLATMTMHLLLHWNWIVTVVAKRCGRLKSVQPSLIRSGLWTLVVVGAMFFGFAWLAKSQVRELAQPCCSASEISDRNQDASLNVSVPESVAKSNGTIVWQDVYPILAQYCVACHGPERQLAGLRVDSREDLLGGTGKTPLIIPMRSGNSTLIAVISGAKAQMAMAKEHRLPEADVALISNWIDQGAR